MLNVHISHRLFWVATECQLKTEFTHRPRARVDLGCARSGNQGSRSYDDDERRLRRISEVSPALEAVHNPSEMGWNSVFSHSDANATIDRRPPFTNDAQDAVYNRAPGEPCAKYP
jgi:hypothetical protein